MGEEVSTMELTGGWISMLIVDVLPFDGLRVIGFEGLRKSLFILGGWRELPPP